MNWPRGRGIAAGLSLGANSSASFELYDLRDADLALNYFTDVAALDDEGLAMELERNVFSPGDNEARERGQAAVDLTKRNFATPQEELRFSSRYAMYFSPVITFVSRALTTTNEASHDERRQY